MGSPSNLPKMKEKELCSPHAGRNRGGGWGDSGHVPLRVRGWGGPRQLWWTRSCAPGLTAQKEGLAELPAPPAAPTQLPPRLGLAASPQERMGRREGAAQTPLTKRSRTTLCKFPVSSACGEGGEVGSWAPTPRQG